MAVHAVLAVVPDAALQVLKLGYRVDFIPLQAYLDHLANQALPQKDFETLQSISAKIERAKKRVAPSEAWPIFCSPQYMRAKNSDPAPAAIAYEVGPLQVLVALLSSVHLTPAAAVTASEPTRMMAT